MCSYHSIYLYLPFLRVFICTCMCLCQIIPHHSTSIEFAELNFVPYLSWHCASRTFSEALNRISYRFILLLFFANKNSPRLCFVRWQQCILSIHQRMGSPLLYCPNWVVPKCVLNLFLKSQHQQSARWDEQLVSAKVNRCRIDPAVGFLFLSVTVQSMSVHSQ